MQVTMESLRDLCQNCTACKLCETRTNVVFGRGAREPEILFIGEAPGQNEDKQGEPFVGAAGKKLDAILQECGIDPAKIYIANVLKCRPPHNRTPTSEEEDACGRYLRAQIELLGPRVIVCLGATATNFVTGETGSITARRGKVTMVDNRPVIPTFHPAATIYDKSKGPKLHEDLKRAKNLCDKLRMG